MCLNKRQIRPGASATELAVILPLLVLIGFACVDFGRVFYASIALRSAARAGAAHAISTPYTPAGAAAWEQEIQQKAREEMEQQTGYDSNQLRTTTTVHIEGTGLRRVRVEAAYDSFQTFITWPGLPSRVTLRQAVEMRAIR